MPCGQKYQNLSNIVTNSIRALKKWSTLKKNSFNKPYTSDLSGFCIIVLIRQLIKQKCEVLVESKFKSNEYCDVVWKELLIIQCKLSSILIFLCASCVIFGKLTKLSELKSFIIKTLVI